MQKPLGDIARHLKSIILSEMPESWEAKPMFTEIRDNESIRQGIVAYRDFLNRFCDYLIVHGARYDKPKKIAHPFSDRVSLPTNYPFLKNMENVLAGLGVRGELSPRGDLLAIDSAAFQADLARISAVKLTECLSCLSENGFRFSGMKLTSKKTNFHGETFAVSYPANPAVLAGIQILSKMRSEFEGTGLYGILLRCDYRAVLRDGLAPGCFLADMMRAIPKENQAFVLKLHNRYLDAGFQCTVSVVDELCIRFFYHYKRKEVWSVIVSANNGYELAVRAKHTDQYAGAVDRFHPYLREKISKGYGCDKKRDPSSYCQGGCKGYRISLTEPLNHFRDDLVTWIDKELLFA